MRAATNTNARHANRTKATGTHRDPGRSNGNRRAIAAVAVRPTAAPAQAVTGIAPRGSAEAPLLPSELRVLRVQVYEDPLWSNNNDPDERMVELHVVTRGENGHHELIRTLNAIAAVAASRYAAELQAAAGAGASKGRGQSGPAGQKGTSSK